MHPAAQRRLSHRAVPARQTEQKRKRDKLFERGDSGPGKAAAILLETGSSQRIYSGFRGSYAAFRVKLRHPCRPPLLPTGISTWPRTRTRTEQPTSQRLHHLSGQNSGTSVTRVAVGAVLLGPRLLLLVVVVAHHPSTHGCSPPVYYMVPEAKRTADCPFSKTNTSPSPSVVARAVPALRRTTALRLGGHPQVPRQTQEPAPSHSRRHAVRYWHGHGHQCREWWRRLNR